MALGNTAVDTLLIIRPVASQRGDWAVGLVEQGTDLRAIIGILVGQHRRDDPPGVGIHADVELPPGPARAGAVLLNQPLAHATQLQARAVHQQVHGFAVAARSWPRHLQRLGPAAAPSSCWRWAGRTDRPRTVLEQSSGRGSNPADVGPHPERTRPRGAVLAGGDVVAAEMKKVVDLVGGGEEALRWAGRLKAFHPPFSSPRRLVRVF